MIPSKHQPFEKSGMTKFHSLTTHYSRCNCFSE